MRSTNGIVALLGFLLVLVATSNVAVAGKSYDACTGFIDSLPAVVSTQGTWCLRRNLSTAATSGSAISIANNSVVIDCNGFKLGGLSAGRTSQTIGVHAFNRDNVTVRDCSLRGFHHGILVENGSGHLIEDNSLDRNLHTGIEVRGDNNLVRRNFVYATGGFSGGSESFGIVADADVFDNMVTALFADSDSPFLTGILVSAPGVEVRRNSVRGMQLGGGDGIGINAVGAGVRLDSNHVFGGGGGTGILGSETGSLCTGNSALNFAVLYAGCAAGSNNMEFPSSP